jgi:hypothetical protein
MKKWLPDIIYKLFRFLLAYIFFRKAKDTNKIRRRATAAPLGSCLTNHTLGY